MRAIHLTAFGNPAQGLEFVQIQEPAAPSSGQALIGVEFSPIDLSDLLVGSGVYPFRPSLPSVIGNEGVGRILAVGPGVDNVAVGDRVLTPLYGLAWAERIVAPAEGLFALPADVDPQQLAMLTINPPTAGLLLSEFVDLAARRLGGPECRQFGRRSRGHRLCQSAWLQDDQSRPPNGTDR